MDGEMLSRRARRRNPEGELAERKKAPLSPGSGMWNIENSGETKVDLV